MDETITKQLTSPCAPYKWCNRITKKKQFKIEQSISLCHDKIHQQVYGPLLRVNIINHFSISSAQQPQAFKLFFEARLICMEL